MLHDALVLVILAAFMWPIQVGEFLSDLYDAAERKLADLINEDED